MSSWSHHRSSAPEESWLARTNERQNARIISTCSSLRRPSFCGRGLSAGAGRCDIVGRSTRRKGWSPSGYRSQRTTCSWRWSKDASRAEYWALRSETQREWRPWRLIPCCLAEFCNHWRPTNSTAPSSEHCRCIQVLCKLETEQRTYDYYVQHNCRPRDSGDPSWARSARKASSDVSGVVWSVCIFCSIDTL